MKNKLIINIALVLLAILFGVLVVKSVKAPIDFNSTRTARETGSWNSTDKKLRNAKGDFEVCVMQSLIDIRDAQLIFKLKNDRYTADFDSLIAFVKTDSLDIVYKVHDESDTTFTKTIDKIVGRKSVLDSIFGKRKNFDINKLGVIPFSQNDTRFEMEASSVMRAGGVKVPVFEARALYETYLWDLDPQRVRNLKAEKEDQDKYPGLKVGSLIDPVTSGNWESKEAL